jgi:hypothetical protein
MASRLLDQWMAVEHTPKGKKGGGQVEETATGSTAHRVGR